MLFYTTLFITSLIVTLVILWLYKLLLLVGKKLIKSGKLVSHAISSVAPSEKKYARNLQYVSQAWGPSDHASPSQLARLHPAKPHIPTPWGWPGYDHETHGEQPKPLASNGATLNAYLSGQSLHNQTVQDWKLNVGRPIRDDRPVLAGKPYKPSASWGPK